MEREIIVNVTCKKCLAKSVARHLLNFRRDLENLYRINSPLGKLILKDNEVELKSIEKFLKNKLNTSYHCKHCGEENHVVIPVTEEMKYMI